jgi:hypothetical protein
MNVKYPDPEELDAVTAVAASPRQFRRRPNASLSGPARSRLTAAA